ncbi:MAG: iron chelate uptake ABC transporter family permease subunit [Anaerolineales bacterium]|nr:iron chelate uptake ABC transporter family permease subunit [Anaerolineales bacterium]
MDLFTIPCAALIFPLSSFFSTPCFSAWRLVPFLFRRLVWRALTGSTTSETFRTILWDIRLPRTVLIALVGAALSGSGAAYQGLFRNPLADPYLIGVASGAGLGAVLAMSIQWPYTALGLLAVPLAAFIASLLTVYLVYLFANVGGTVPTTSLNFGGRWPFHPSQPR